jgi:hypothetical protein
MNKQQLEDLDRDKKYWKFIAIVFILFSLAVIYGNRLQWQQNYEQGFQDGQSQVLNSLSTCYFVNNETLYSLSINLQDYSCEDIGLESELKFELLINKWITLTQRRNDNGSN